MVIIVTISKLKSQASPVVAIGLALLYIPYIKKINLPHLFNRLNSS